MDPRGGDDWSRWSPRVDSWPAPGFERSVGPDEGEASLAPTCVWGDRSLVRGNEATQRLRGWPAFAAAAVLLAGLSVAQLTQCSVCARAPGGLLGVAALQVASILPLAVCWRWPLPPLLLSGPLTLLMSAVGQQVSAFQFVALLGMLCVITVRRSRLESGPLAAAAAAGTIFVRRHEALDEIAFDLALGGTPSGPLVSPAAGLQLALGSLVAGALGEEFGWRGLAQPGLQRRHGALLAAVLVGLIWATWHLWPWIGPGGGGLFSWSDLVSTYVRMVSTAVIYAWIYNSTRGSLLVVMLAHTGHNIAVQVVGGAGEAGLATAILYCAVAIVVIIATDRRTLTRVR
jgi:membrane protease YdiL (CAAX protease family)